VAIELNRTRLGTGYGVLKPALHLPIGYLSAVVDWRHPRPSQGVHHKAEECRRRAVPHLESKTDAAEVKMLSIWRPYSVSIISRSNGQSP
jgi:hypothetical protein